MPSWVRSGLLEMSRISASESDSLHKTSSLSRPCKDYHTRPCISFFFYEKCRRGINQSTSCEGAMRHLAPGNCKERRFPGPREAGKKVLFNLKHITDVSCKATCNH